jgi:hypothetical protein
MTRFIRAAVMTGGLVGVVAIGTASAQIDSPVEFTTTFPFTVGNATVPAGKYMIRPAEDDDLLLDLQGLTNHVSVYFEVSGTQAPKPEANTSVVFKRYGDHYVLKDIWVEGEQDGAEALTVRGEKHHMKEDPPPTEHRVKATKRTAAPKPTASR